MHRAALAPFWLGTLAAGASVAWTALPASAVQVMVGGEIYEVTVQEIAFNDQPSLFDSPTNGGMMPWWGSPTDAEAIAAQVGGSLGPLAPSQPFSDFGPLFAFDLIKTGPTVDFVDAVTQLIVPPANSQFNYQATPDETLRYAVGVRVTPPEPVPAPVPVLGVSIFFGWSRQLRKRLRTTSRNSPASGSVASTDSIS